jgi:hypothetical protein
VVREAAEAFRNSNIPSATSPFSRGRAREAPVFHLTIEHF